MEIVYKLASRGLETFNKVIQGNLIRLENLGQLSQKSSILEQLYLNVDVIVDGSSCIEIKWDVCANVALTWW